MTAECTIKVNNPAELIAAVPYLIGFHPSDSVVVVAVRGTQIMFVARHDLPGQGLLDEVIRSDAAEVAAVVASQGVTGATVIGYGTDARVAPTVFRVDAALIKAGVPVLDQLRVADGRFWSYLCARRGCCTEQGRPCLPPDSAIAAAATFSGAVALPDRAALIAQIAPGATASSVAAHKRLDDLFTRESHQAGLVRQLRRAGRAAVREAERRYRSGRRLTDDEVAWLGLLLVYLPVRDYAWGRIGESPWWVSLWTDVLRRVESIYTPAPAGLLAFAAWRDGQGALAQVAIDRALEQEPRYEMALLLHELLQLGVNPRVVDGWPVPEPRGNDVPAVRGLWAAPPGPPAKPWRVDLPLPGRAVVDQRLGRSRGRGSKRRGPRRRAL